jgi:hypothetical protein
MDFDFSKWFDVLKANAWQYFCLAIGCIALLLADARGWLPIKFDATFMQIVVILAFAFAALWVASVGSSIQAAMRLPWAAIKRRRARRPS